MSYLYLLVRRDSPSSAHQMLARHRDPVLASAPEPAGKWSDALDLDSHYRDRELGREVISVYIAWHSGCRSCTAPASYPHYWASAAASSKSRHGYGVRLPIKVSSATSNFMIGVTAAASAGAYFMRGSVVTEVAAPVAFGSVLGAIVGGRLLLIVPNNKLRLLFVMILVALGIQMLLVVFGGHLVEGSR